MPNATSYGPVKRFKLQTGHIIKVNDCDSHILRMKVWNAKSRVASGKLRYIVYTSNATYAKNFLSHYLVGDGYISHINGDDLDFTRENLKQTSKEIFYAEFSTKGRKALQNV